MSDKVYITTMHLKIGALVILGGGVIIGTLPGATRLYGKMITNETVVPFVAGGVFLIAFAKAGHRIGYIPRERLDREKNDLETACDDHDRRVVAYGGFTVGIIILMLSIAHCVAVVFPAI